MDHDYRDGVIVNCERAPIYASVANRSLLGHVDCDKSVLIDFADEIGDYYHIYTETSISGYCNKKYVEVA